MSADNTITARFPKDLKGTRMFVLTVVASILGTRVTTCRSVTATIVAGGLDLAFRRRHLPMGFLLFGTYGVS